MSIPYHRLLRVHPRYRWWKPLVAILVLLAGYLVSQILITIAFIVPLLVSGGPDELETFLHTLQTDPLSSSNPMILGLTLGSLVLLLPVAMLSFRMIRLGGFGQLSSIRFRIRWRWMAVCLLPLVAFLVILLAVQGLPLLLDPSSLGHATTGGWTLLVSVLLIVLLVPFQAAAEEYIFRGMILQVIGSWLKNPIVPVVVSTLAFAIAHKPNGYNIWGLVDVGSFGAIAAILVIRTGGLEAGIIAHATNNIVLFLLQAPGWSGIAGQSGDGSFGGAMVTLGSMGIYWGLVEIAAKVTRLERRRPGREAPRFLGTAPAPAWAETRRDGWGDVPALHGAAPVAALGGSVHREPPSA